MRLFFLRCYFSVVLFTVAVFTVTVFVIFKPFLQMIEWQEFNKDTDKEFMYLSVVLADHSMATWDEAVANHSTFSPVSIQLVLEENLTPQQKQLISGAERKFVANQDSEKWFSIYPLKGSQWYAKISEDVTGGKENGPNSNKQLIFWLTFPLFLLLASQAFATILVLRSISKPIKKLTQTTLSFGEGDFSVRSDQKQPPVDGLATSFNNMADQLEKKIATQEIMISAIPHELRTPLSRIRFALDMSRNVEETEKLKSYIEKVDQYVDDLHIAVEDVLEFERLSKKDAHSKEQFNLHVLLLQAADVYQTEDILINVDCDPALVVVGNQGLIRRSIHNLIKNAVTFTRSHVSVKVSDMGENINIQVIDDGSGVPEEELKFLSTLFYRSDKSRTRGTGGIGLGLAFVDRIMQLHDGSLRFSNAAPNGLCVEIEWPNC